MPKVRVAGFAMSIDGFSAGINQSQADPLGQGGLELFQWYFPTRAFRAMHSPGSEGKPGEDPGGETGVDNDYAAKAMSNFGAFILGRNMFGPVRGPWPDESWRGWWGPNPPYHTPTFVLTHHARAPLVMEGGTTFHFVTDGIDAALDRARAAAGDRDIRLLGGAQTIRQYLLAGLVDEMQLAVSPVLLGSGESLFEGLDLPQLGYRASAYAAGERAAFMTVTRA